MKITVELGALQEMHEGWRRKAIVLANGPEAVQEELQAAAKANKAIPAKRVLEMLNLSVPFYKAIGGEAVLTELLTSLGSPPPLHPVVPKIGATSLQSDAPPAPAAPTKGWKIR